MALFRHGGLEAVTMRAVASQVGVSAMAPYRYFADKSDLLNALWQRVMGDLYEAMAAAAAKRGSATARYRAAVEAYFRYYEGHPDEFWLANQTQQGSHSNERPGSGQAEVYVRLLSLLRQLLLDIAGELGATDAYVKDAQDLAFLVKLGYLQAALVNRRYPWNSLSRLRAATVEQICKMVSRCLVHGPLGEGEMGSLRRKSDERRPNAPAGKSRRRPMSSAHLTP